MAAASITLVDTRNPIPKETGMPILGCLPEFAKDPLAFFARLARQYDDVVEFHLPMRDMALVTNPDLAHQILVKEIRHFRKSDRDMRIMGTVLGKGLVTNNDFLHHKTQRKLVQPGFHFRRIESYTATMTDYTQRYLESWTGGETRDIADDMFKLTLYIVSKTLFNIDMSSLERGADTIGKAMQVVQTVINKRFTQVFHAPDWVPTPNNRKLIKARAVLNKTIESMIASRTLPNGEVSDAGDMMSMLLKAEYEDGSQMDKKMVMDELITLFVAGHETTSNALSWAFYLLAKHPDIQQKLQCELDTVLADDQPAFTHLENLVYTERVVKEAMRLLPPVWTLNTRQANEDIVIGDYFFPKDKVVFISPYANHHNPRYFKDPDTFDPDRFLPENEKRLPRQLYIPFGTGPRVCIGQSFAMMEAKLILASVIQKFEITIAKSQKIEPQAQITLSNKEGMKVIIKKRKRR